MIVFIFVVAIVFAIVYLGLTLVSLLSGDKSVESLVYFTEVRILRSKKPFGGHGRIEGVCEASHRFIFWPFRVKRELVYFDSSGVSSCEIFLDDGGFPFCYQEVKQKLAHGLQDSHDDEVLAVRSVAAAKLVSSVGTGGVVGGDE